MVLFVNRSAKMWRQHLLMIVCIWNVARYVRGICPKFHSPEIPIQGVFGKTLILRCNLRDDCYEGMWLINKYGDRLDASLDCNEAYCVAANDAESKNTLYLYNLTYDQISSYDCACKSPSRTLYFCYDLTAVCQLEMKVGNTKTAYNGSYLDTVQRTYSIDIKEWSSFNIKCQPGAQLTTNCSETTAIASMFLDGCEYTCSLPMAAGIDPCIVKVILQVNASIIEEELSNFEFPPITNRPIDNSSKSDKVIENSSKSDRLPPSPIRVTSGFPLIMDASTPFPDKKRRFMGAFFPPSTPLHTKFLSIIIYCCSIGVMLLLAATSMVRIYHIYIKGEGKYKADVYRPGSIYGQPPTDKDYRKYADVIHSDTLTGPLVNSHLLSQYRTGTSTPSSGDPV